MDSLPVLYLDRNGARELVRVSLGNYYDLVDNISIVAIVGGAWVYKSE